MRGHWRLKNLERASESDDSIVGLAHAAFGTVHLAQATRPQRGKHMKPRASAPPLDPMTSGIYTWAPLAPLTCGDLAAARRWADDVVSVTTCVEFGGIVDIALPRLDRTGRARCRPP